MRLVISAAVAAFLLSACLPVFSPGNDRDLREALTRSLIEMEVQQALIEGRRFALVSPSARVNLLQQGLEEYRYIADDPVTGLAFMDLQVSHLERAAETAPHDHRLRRLVALLLKEALADPELRPMLAEALRNTASSQGVQVPPGNTAPSPAEKAEPSPEKPQERSDTR